MKKILYCLALVALIATGCKKQNLNNPSPLLSSFRVVNAVSDAGALFVNRYPSGTYYSALKDSLTFRSTHEYGVPNGTLALKLIGYRDTTKQFFKGQFDVMPLKTYSFYITGFGNKIDTVYKAETNFPRYLDSAVAIRVINLAVGGPVVNVSLASSPNTTEFSGLGYKMQSGFKKYVLTSAVASSGSLTFNVTDDSGNVLTRYNLPQYSFVYPPLPTVATARFKAITLVIAGDINAVPYSQNAYTIFPVANY